MTQKRPTKQELKTFPNYNTLYAYDDDVDNLIDEKDDLLQRYEKSNQRRTSNVKFVRPLLDFGHPPTVTELEDGTLSDKPLLLYLPGFDGTYMSPFIQFPELGTEFDVWCMTVGMDDRSTFEELKQNVLDFILNSDHDDDSTNQTVESKVRDNSSKKTATTGTAENKESTKNGGGNVLSIFGNNLTQSTT